MKRIPKKMILGLVGSSLAIAAWAIVLSRSSSGGTETDKGAQDEGIPVSVQTVTSRTVAETVSAVGTVEAWHDVVVSAEGAGKVVAIYADEGDLVSKGTVMVKLDDEHSRLAVEQAEAQRAMAQANYRKAVQDLKRNEEVFDSEGISPSQMERIRLGAETAKASLRLAEIGLKMAQKQRRDTEIKSPLSGQMAERYVDVGEMVSPGMPMANVIDIRRAKVRVSVSEEEIVKVKQGQRAVLRVDAHPERQFEGTVSYAGLKADPRSRSFPVEVEVGNDPEAPLRSGMIARVDIQVREHRNTLLIPRDAVLDRQDGPMVYVLNSNTASRRTLVLGRRWDELVVVKEGLHEGDQLIVAGQERLSDGTKVRVE